MRIARKLSGPGSFLIDMNPAWAEKIGPLGLAAVCGTVSAAIALVVLWGFAHAGLLHRSHWFAGLPVFIGAYLGALNGWKDWRRNFDASYWI